jgi:hypothetical protein
VLSSFSLAAVSLAAGSSTAATDEQEISPVLENQVEICKIVLKIHFTSYLI